MEPAPGASPDWRDRFAHALTPWEWRARSLAVMLVLFGAVGAVTVVQRALVAEGAAGWTWVAVHAVVVVVAVAGLGARAVRRWRQLQTAASGAQPRASEPS